MISKKIKLYNKNLVNSSISSSGSRGKNLTLKKKCKFSINKK